MKLKKTLFTLTVLFIAAQWAFAFNGSGTQSSPYLIENVSDWTSLANNVASGQSYSGKFFKMTADIRTDVMVGKYKSENDAFKGTFDGNGHTICFVFTESGYNDYDIAPFRSINGATIKNLFTTGVITIGSYGNDHAAGIVCRTYGNCTISSCRSDISINGKGGGVYGGIVSHVMSGTITLTDVLFDGCILGPSAEQCAGFVGYVNSQRVLTFNNCLYAPGLHTVSDINSSGRNGTFYRMTASTQTLNNCYYTQALGVAQGEKVDEADIAYTSFKQKLGNGWTFANGSDIPLPVGACNSTCINGYAVYDSGTQTMTFYSDGNASSHTATTETVFPLPCRRQDPSWYNQVEEDLKHVVFDPSFSNAFPVNCSYWFRSCNQLQDFVGMEYLNTSFVNSMERMFANCSKLPTLDLSHFNTTNVVDMNYMFTECQNLQTLDLLSFNTPNVKNMNGMFDYCTGITYLDLSSFDTRNVTGMSDMFILCQNLEKIDISSFDTKNVKTMESMFHGCEKLAALDLRHFNTSSVENMLDMFYNTSALRTLDLSTFNTSNVTDMRFMFEGSGIVTLDISNFNTSKVKNMSYMFFRCQALSTIYAGSGWNMDNVENTTGMFDFCESIVGSSGTTFDEDKVNGEYAHIDGGAANPGYLSANLPTVTLKDNADNSSAIVDGNSPCKVVLQGRTLYKDGTWNTLCLPFDLPLSSSVLHDAEVMTLDGASYRKGTLTLNFTPVTSMIEAGRPYIVKWEDGYDMTNPVFLGVTLSTANNPVVIDNVISLQGIYSPLEIPAEDNTKLYMGANNKLYYPSAAMKINAFRAYFHLAEGIIAGNLDTTEGIKQFVLNFGEKETTGIDINNREPITDNHWYTLNGTRINVPSGVSANSVLPKGVYIYNGKKVVVK